MAFHAKGRTGDLALACKPRSRCNDCLVHVMGYTSTLKCTLRDATSGMPGVAGRRLLFLRCRSMITAMSFSHLEVHSHFTLLGATPSVAALVGRATADGLTHLALTDTNALYGAVAFGRACRAAGIQPIIGMTVTTADPAFPAPAGDAAGKLVLLAADANGYRSLCRLSSLIQGSPQREALAARGLDGDALAAHRTGLICLSGGQEGWIERFLRAGDAAAARGFAARLGGIFEQNLYLAPELHAPGGEGLDAGDAQGARGPPWCAGGCVCSVSCPGQFRPCPPSLRPWPSAVRSALRAG